MDLVEEVGSGCCSSVPTRPEEPMVTQERWAEIRQLFYRDHLSISEIARRMDLDRKTVCLGSAEM